jgi:hypothetical protein
LDHFQQPPAMPPEQLAERMMIPRLNAVSQRRIIVGMAGHEWSPIPITAENCLV